MSPIEPRDAADQQMLWRLAAAWVRDRPAGGTGSRLLDSVLSSFPLVSEGALLQEAAKAAPPVDTGPTFGWLMGRPLPKSVPPAIPVATVQVDSDDDGTILRCCIRVAIFAERHDGTVDVHGWRFELEENDEDALHPYHHAQPIVGWTISGICLLHPTNSCAEDCNGLDLSGVQEVDADRLAMRTQLDQSHPAFPFATTTMTGLLAAAMTTLYGARTLRTIVSNETRLSRASGAVAEDLRRLMG